MNKLLSFKKYIIISLVLSVLVLCFSFLFYNNNYIIFLKNYEQNIITYIDSKIKHFKKNNPNIDIKFKKIKMNVDGVNLKDIQINIKPDKKISIYSLNLDLDWWSLLALKVKFKLTIPKVYLKIKTNKIKFKTNKTNNVTPESFLAELNNEVYNIKKNKDLLSFLNLPISSLNILEANIDIINKKNNKYIAKINNSIITLNLNKRNKKIDFFSASVSFPGSLLKKEFFSLHLKSEIKNKHLLLRAKIGYKNLSALIKIKNKFTEFRIVTKLKSLSEILQKTSLQKGLDHLNGNLFLTIKKESDNAFSFTSKLSNFKSHGFKIGDLKSNGILKNSKLNVNYVNIESPIWAGQTKSFVINLNKKPYHISFDANVDKFKLHNLLGDKYISLFAKSLASCSGKFFPFLLNCSLTNTHVDNVKIYLKNKKEVLHAPALKGLSQVNISADSVNFKSSFSSITNSNKNKITVSANINYYDDSIINYKASLKDLSFITFFKKNLLGDAKISGSVKIKKNITINKNSFKSNNISLGKEFLGKLKFNSLYQDQQLAIKKIFFKNRDEQINGSLVFLFKKNSLFSNIKAQNINLSRIKPFLNIKQKHFFYGKIKKIFSKTLWNLDFQPLSSDTKLVISNLLIKKVYFPEINIYLKKNITNNFTLINLDSLNKTFNISGYIFNNLKLLLNLSAKKMALENFINFANPSSVTSLVDIKSKIKGTILNLNVKMNLKFYKTYINKIIQKNSAAVVKYSNNKISVVANFFNKTVSTNLVWNVKKMYLHNLFFKADNWDYSSLVYFYSKTNKHIKSKLTAKLSIVKKKNNKYSGALNIPSVSFKHPDINFKNKKPLLVTLKNNILFFKNFSLKGKSGYMNVYSNPNSNLDKLNIKINSKINLALFNNFLSESLITSGNLFLNNLKITGNLFKPLLNGNIKINKLAAKNTDKIIPSIQDSDINININNSKAILNKFIINLKNKAVLNAYG
ncbi:MAG: hypothetical protein HAW60_05570, partial [Bdellovibrionales bacterium]|nr:hypothetical protein [Bdellovibrionales bacterium]